ncbi:type I-E CRISPR-associated protein Cas7/Cse4/CasC [Kitasatospora sp. NRRL B-11411]|uniref:type I-E CRISPR-associated protein Cas7/Cse4/CasC n=1 Tax=Kitasatospora sp. NRRL B-11411 TaxID=1463822 RepID=UPI000690AA75|nr:type I-E CRISPR-associated protein Cas7/Cse4/CasC [Kitasatospora sp. NRRL B-11411]
MTADKAVEGTVFDPPQPVHVDVHLLQSFPYSNLNRDRNGVPKVATYGAVTRGRLSAQNTRRHTRADVEKALGVRALRTRQVPQEVAAILAERGWDLQQALAAAQMLIHCARVKGLGIAESGGTNALLFLPESALTEFADLADAEAEALKVAVAAVEAGLAKPAKKRGSKKTAPFADEDQEREEEEERESARAKAMDAHAPKELKAPVLAILRSRNAAVAAYGRMLANEAASSVNGAVQVAHGLTTHRLSVQTDFFSAVDDVLKGGTESGAGHIGDQRYTSGVYHRYASLNWPELLHNLDGDEATAREVLEAFVRAFITTVLPAKGNNTAAFTVPHLVYVVVRTDRPVNLVGAFESPVQAAEDGGFLPGSLAALSRHAAATDRFLGTAHRAFHAHAGLVEDAVPDLGERMESLDDLISSTTDAVTRLTA